MSVFTESQPILLLLRLPWYWGGYIYHWFRRCDTEAAILAIDYSCRRLLIRRSHTLCRLSAAFATPCCWLPPDFLSLILRQWAAIFHRWFSSLFRHFFRRLFSPHASHAVAASFQLFAGRAPYATVFAFFDFSPSMVLLLRQPRLYADFAFAARPSSPLPPPPPFAF